MVRDQRIRFWDESFLEFTILVNDSLELEEYNFHFQERDGTFIWRKDKHPHHEEEVGGLTHIHDNPSDPDEVRAYFEVDLAEVIEEVRQHHEETGSPP